MVNERYDDKFEGQEEGEYHFSDEQSNYEMEVDATVKDTTATVVAVSPKESLVDKLKQHRRIIIGIVVFIVLLGIVYRLIVPSSAPPTTDFAPQSTPTKQAAPPTPSVQAVAPTASPPIQQVPPQPAVQQQPSPAATSVPPVATPPPSTAQVAAQPVTVPPPAAQPTQQPSPPVVSTTTVMTTTPVVPGMGPPDTAGQSKTLLDRIATLEQQNSAMMNMLQTQYVQKIADTEMQNNQLRTEVQELNARVGSIEVAFRQLTKILRDMRSAGMIGDSGYRASPVKSVQPKIGFTVQAIIPGRAWLKSDSGDTVTVAEGDVLKDFGRVTKIDPYDGIVNIDTGNKMVTLSYGVNGD